MRQSIAGCLLVALASAALGPGRAPAQDLSLVRFRDWIYYNDAGQRALMRGDLDAAAKRFLLAIEIARPAAATNPRPLARSYSDYALVLLLQGRAKEAEPLAEWALKAREERFGKDSEQAAATLHVLALLASAQMQYPRSEALLTRAIAIWEKRLGPNHPRVAIGLTDLATLYSLQRKYEQAEPLFLRVLEMPRSDLPPNHPDRAISLIGLASIYAARGEFEKVESTDKQLITLMASMSPLAYMSISQSLEQYLAQLRKLGRADEVAMLEEAAEAARKGGNSTGPRRGEMHVPSVRLGPRSS